MKLGRNTTEQINDESNWAYQRRIKEVIKFLDDEDFGEELFIGDFGDPNLVKTKIEDHYNICIHSIYGFDFNYAFPPIGNGFDTLMCFEIIEHVMNPLLLLNEMKEFLTDKGVLYLSTPYRPKFLHPDYHFTEYSDKKLEGWLFKEAGLQIEKKQFIRFRGSLKQHLGIRPMIRWMIDGTRIYKLRKA